jgi:ABC-type branched-subunit amino acid transport system permease subunit
MNWNTHGKSIMMGLGAVVMAAVTSYQAVAGNGVTLSEWVTVVIGVFGAVNVWAVANVPAFSKAKTLVAALFVVLNLLVGFLTDGRLTGDEITNLVIQALATLGVAAAPAVSVLARPLTGTAPSRFSSNGS